MASAKRQAITAVLLILGIAGWLTQTGAVIPINFWWLGGAIGLLIAAVGSWSRTFRAISLRLGRKLDSRRFAAALLVGIVSAAYLLFEASRQPGEMFFRIHDEHSYMIQARMLAEGRLWLHGYPASIAPFFDTFYMFVNPVYASMYFPGTALAAVPSIWLHLPYWTTPLLCGAVAASVFYSIAGQLVGGLRAFLAALLLITRPYFRLTSLMLLSEAPALLANLTMIWAWLWWRQKKGLGRAIVLGAAAGWSAIVRPLDAVCFAIPIAIAITIELRRQPERLLKTVALAAVGALPFAALQIVQDIGVSGTWYQPPVQLYHISNFPGPAMGFGPYDLSRLPAGMSRPKQAFAETQLALYREHTLGKELATWYSQRFTQLRYVALPGTMLVVFLPLAFARMPHLRRKVVAAALLLFLTGYTACVFRLDFYMVPAIPLVILMVMMGWESLERAWPALRWRFYPLIALGIAGFAIFSLPQFNPNVRSLPAMSEQMKWINSDLAGISTPALVLFRFDPSILPVSCFPVFNDGVAWPDDAPVVRANDLGEGENWKLYDYYARYQPDRRVFAYVRTSDHDAQPLKYLGTAGELAALHGRDSGLR